MRASTRSRMVLPPIRMRALSPPPMRRASPPASTRPRGAVMTPRLRRSASTAFRSNCSTRRASGMATKPSRLTNWFLELPRLTRLLEVDVARAAVARAHVDELDLAQRHADAPRHEAGDVDDGAAIGQRVGHAHAADIVPERRQHHAEPDRQERDAEQRERAARRRRVGPEHRKGEERNPEQKRLPALLEGVDRADRGAPATGPSRRDHAGQAQSSCTAALRRCLALSSST